MTIGLHKHLSVMIKGLCFMMLCCVTVFSQQLEIHHINTNNGESTIIALKNSDNEYTSKIIIDGGNSSFTRYLDTYIGAVFGNYDFDCVILTHYHRDHYAGLLRLKNGDYRAAYVIDPGGYSLNNYDPNKGRPPANEYLNPGNTDFPPVPTSKSWQVALKTYSYINAYFTRPELMDQFPRDIYHYIDLGDIDGHSVYLTCIAAAGYNIADDVKTKNNNISGRTNPNNFSLGFVLQWGEFRYYTAGDIGGYKANYTSHDGKTIPCSSYIDQETDISDALGYIVSDIRKWDATDDTTYIGHVCAFKASHHGSACANNDSLLGSMRAAVSVSMAGRNSSWKLPHPEFLYRLKNAHPLSSHADAGEDDLYNRGIYFTNLYDFYGQPSLTVANKYFFNKKGLSYDYGNHTTGERGNYVIIVPYAVEALETDISHAAVFCVRRVDIVDDTPQWQSPHWFLCHKK